MPAGSNPSKSDEQRDGISARLSFWICILKLEMTRAECGRKGLTFSLRPTWRTKCESAHLPSSVCPNCVFPTRLTSSRLSQCSKMSVREYKLLSVSVVADPGLFPWLLPSAPTVSNVRVGSRETMSSRSSPEISVDVRTSLSNGGNDSFASCRTPV